MLAKASAIFFYKPGGGVESCFVDKHTGVHIIQIVDIFATPPPFSKMMIFPPSTVKISSFPPIFTPYIRVFSELIIIFSPQPTNNSYFCPPQGRGGGQIENMPPCKHTPMMSFFLHLQ